MGQKSDSCAGSKGASRVGATLLPFTVVRTPMRTPAVFLAYSPRGAGLRCAIAYLAFGRDVCGWFTGPREDLAVASCFFLLEDLYTRLPARYEAVDHAELHSAWSLDEARRHELAQMQEAFAREWLFRRDGARAAAELEAYAAAELAV